MSYSFRCKSHPGKLLKDHVCNVYDNGILIADKLNLDKDVLIVLKVALLLHDTGKASSYFQKYIEVIEDFEKEEITKAKFEEIKHDLRGKKQHARISALWTFLLLDQIFDNQRWPFMGYAIVLKHHGHLDNIDEIINLKIHQAARMDEINKEINYQEINHLFNLKSDIEFDFNQQKMSNAISDFFNTRKFRRKWKRQFKEILDYNLFIETSLLFSILLSADKGECIFDGVIYRRDKSFLPSNVVGIFKSKTFGKPNSKLNKLREEVYRTVGDSITKTDRSQKFFSINVPTGIGKTLTAINAGITLANSRSDIEKIVYCLPFTSVIDQNAHVVEEILESNDIVAASENLLVNHHLSEIRYTNKNDDIDFEINKAEYLVNQFEASISITTFYQLLHGILSRYNRELRKLHSFANSIVILDEVQSIPSKYWQLVKEVFLDLAERLNITFILVTATLPMIFSERKGEITELVSNKKEIFESLSRIVLDTSQINEPLGIESLTDHLIHEINSNRNKSFLIILNTIKSSKKLYRLLEDEGYTNLIYLSTTLPPIERLRRIKEIKVSKTPYIVVSTQLVEAGVDIDLDIIYRDLAPLDSIFQSAGRCNRNDGEDKGEVRIVVLKDEHKRRFANYIYGDADLDLTQTILKQKKLWDESNFFELANTYYSGIDTSYDDSKYILQKMDELSYRDAFDVAENEKAFQLIENLPTVPAYIAFETEAKKLLEEFRITVETNFDSSYEKRQAINKIRKEMAKYFVSIPERYAFEIQDMFFVISEERRDFEYSDQTGVDFDLEQSSMII